MKKLNVYAIVLSLIWAGMLLGISFLEAPVKFTAPSLTLSVGLDVGRHVFQAFNKVEIVFGTLALILLLRTELTFLNKSLFATILIMLLLQCFWLLPALDERALIIIAGGTPVGESSLHNWYILFDTLKVIGLIVIGVKSITGFAKTSVEI